MKIPTNFEQWTKALIAAVVTGGANSFLAAVGVGGAQAVGVQIQNLSRNQLIATTISGAMVGMMAYLSKSPVPPDAPPATAQPVQPVQQNPSTPIIKG